METIKLKYYGGIGYDSFSEIGIYEVRGNETKQFQRLSKAKQYYENLDEEKSIWNIEGCPELIECHTL